MPRPMRCPSCGAETLGHLDSLSDLSSGDDPCSYQAIGIIDYTPTYVAEHKSMAKSTFLDRKPALITTRQHLNKKVQGAATVKGKRTITKSGTMEAVVCASCGRIETRVQDPQWMPFDRLAGFSWVNDPGGAGGDEP